eukprot:1150565-Pelagomonas_calceolata.AAC.6
MVPQTAASMHMHRLSFLLNARHELCRHIPCCMIQCPQLALVKVEVQHRCGQRKGPTDELAATHCAVCCVYSYKLSKWDQGKLDKLQSELHPEASITSAVADVIDAKQVEAAVKKALDTYGRISGVANCTGSIVLRSAHATSEAEFDQVGRSNCGK